MNWLTDNQVILLKRPPQLPDLNPTPLGRIGSKNSEIKSKIFKFFQTGDLGVVVRNRLQSHKKISCQLKRLLEVIKYKDGNTHY